MIGQVTSYTGTTLVLNSLTVGGSGTKTAWTISISGPQGAAGTMTATGSPASGNLTKFSGATSVTNANLTGDVTTSDTLATTIVHMSGPLQITAGAIQANVTALTSSSSHIAISLSANNEFTHTLTESTTLDNPTNITVGQSGSIKFTQHDSSPKTLAYGSYWKFPGGTIPTLTATNGAFDTLYYSVRSTTLIEANLVKGFA
jgi:hypothetical protein